MIDCTSLTTAVARFLILVPLVLFFWKQSHLNAKNGDVGRVRRATLAVVLFLTVMFGNLIWVNLHSAFVANVSPITGAKYIAMISSVGLAGSLWWIYALFKRIQK